MINTRQDAVHKLSSFIKNGLNTYSSQRNFDFGPQNRTNVSNLSPFIKKRIIHEEEVLNECLKVKKYEHIEKFIQEVFWRTYWKGWLEGRSEVWEKYKMSLNELVEQHKFGIRKKNYDDAVNARTGIDCFDFWINELIEFGYLHNHSRMWFASIWIHTLNLPWQLGANFFLKHLLDGDPASNTLSWRWVAGLHTQGKSYLANEDNINKFTQNRFKNKKNLSLKPKIFDYDFYEYTPRSFEGFDEKLENNNILINLNNISYNKKTFDIYLNNNICFIETMVKNDNSEVVEAFNKKALEEYISILREKNAKLKIFKDVSDFINYLNKNNCDQIFTFYPSVGRQKDFLDYIAKVNNLNLTFIYDDFDQMCWPFASSGFFKFKKKIPFFLDKVTSN